MAPACPDRSRAA